MVRGKFCKSAKRRFVKQGVLWQTGNRQLDCTLTTEYQYGDILECCFAVQNIFRDTKNLTHPGDTACRMMRGLSCAMKYLSAIRRIKSRKVSLQIKQGIVIEEGKI